MAALQSVTEHRAGGLRFNGVSKTYSVDGKPLQVLENIQLEVAAGQFVCLVGPSGCGKSTILRLIIGLDRDHDGEILLEGKAINGPGLERSIVFQEHRLFPWLTVEQNVALGLDSADLSKAEKARHVREHIELVGLSGFEKAYPHQLSGGMAQRAAIARGLVARPEVLLLDEPLGALDSLTRHYLQQELLRIWRQEQVTMLMVTHDAEEAIFLSDRVVVLAPRPGRIRSVVDVDLPHPRNRTSPEFTLLKESLLAELAGWGGDGI